MNIEDLKKYLLPLINEHGFILEKLQYGRKDKENYLTIEVERKDLSPIRLDEIEKLSNALSTKLDEIDLIDEEYILDVSTSGAEKELHDLSILPKLVGRKMEIRLNNPIKGENIYLGILKEIDDNHLTLSYKVKTRSMEVNIDLENIAKAKLAV